MCERSDLVMLQEVHGSQADLELWRVEMPDHYFVGTLLDGSGGSVMAMRRTWMQAAIPLVMVLDVGRILAVQLVIPEKMAVNIINVHLDPSYGTEKRRTGRR